MFLLSVEHHGHSDSVINTLFKEKIKQFCKVLGHTSVIPYLGGILCAQEGPTKGQGGLWATFSFQTIGIRVFFVLINTSCCLSKEDSMASVTET